MEIDWKRYQTDQNYRISIIRQLDKENKTKSAKNNPEIQTKQTQLDEADKRMTEKRSADEHVAENYGNKAWGKVGGLMVGAGLGTTAGIYVLPWINAAVTPSTYLDALGAPNWAGTTANLGTSFYFLQDNARKFKRDPTLMNGVNTALSFIPASRVNYSELGKVGQWLNTRMVANSVRDESNIAKFLNIPILHSSNKGVTEGAGLRAASDSDVGFHFAPIAEPVAALAVQRSQNFPFMREGWWSFTKNNAPMQATDTGIWSKYFNPDFYEGAGRWEYPQLSETVQDVLHASQRGTNYEYANNFEGGWSFMTTEPYMSVVLSSNALAPRTRPVAVNNADYLQKLLKRSPFGKNNGQY